MERQIIVPLAEDDPSAHVTRNVQMRLSYRHGKILSQMVRALKSANMEAPQPSGKLERVENPTKAIRWLLEQIARDRE